MKKIIFCFCIILGVTAAVHAGGIWNYYNSFNMDTSLMTEQCMFLAADAAGNLYSSPFNSSPNTADVHFFKISNWLSGSPTFWAFDTIPAISSGRSGYGIAVDASGNVYGSADYGVAASSFYKVWSPTLSLISAVYYPSSGRPTGIAVDNDTTNAKGRHLYHGDLVNGKIRVRNMLDQSIAGGSTFDQLKPGTYPRDLVLQPIAGTDTAYNLWVNLNRTIIRIPNVSGRAIEADTGNVLRYTIETVVNNPSLTVNALGIAYDSSKNTIIYTGGGDVGNSIGHTMRIINATTGAEIQVLGTPDTPGNDNLHFDTPADAVTVNQGGKHYLAVSDTGNYRIVVFKYGIPVTPDLVQLIRPGETIPVTADTTATNGTIHWSLSTTGLGVLSATTGVSVEFTANSGNVSGTLTIIATDADGDTGSTATITITPTNAPLYQESESVNWIHYQPQWSFTE